MTIIRFRLSGGRDDADAVIAALHGLDNIEHVEEVDDLMPVMRDDSSSSESVSDSEGQVYVIEVDAPTDQAADTVRVCAEIITHERNAGIEFINDF